ERAVVTRARADVQPVMGDADLDRRRLHASPAVAELTVRIVAPTPQRAIGLDPARMEWSGRQLAPGPCQRLRLVPIDRIPDPELAAAVRAPAARDLRRDRTGMAASRGHRARGHDRDRTR